MSVVTEKSDSKRGRRSVTRSTEPKPATTPQAIRRRSTSSRAPSTSPIAPMAKAYAIATTSIGT